MGVYIKKTHICSVFYVKILLYIEKENVMKNFNLKGINAETITGIAVLLLALINACLRMFGIDTLPIGNEELGNIISIVFLIITALYNTWKNRNMTTAAQAAQEITDAIKNGEILVEDVKEIVNRLKK